MFIGHLPAGYLLTKRIQNKIKIKKYLGVGLIASVLPDVDILYFYLIDDRQHNHHTYWIHLPFYWLIMASAAFLLIRFFGKKEYNALALIFFANIFLHLFLDTIVGHISWLFPLTEKTVYFFEVPAIYDFWVYNFVFHWTFLFEIGVVIWALCVFLKTKKRPVQSEILNKSD